MDRPTEMLQPSTITSRRHKRPPWAQSWVRMVFHFVNWRRLKIAEAYWLHNRPASEVARLTGMNVNTVEQTIKRLAKE